MKFFCVAAVLATASAFTGPAAFAPHTVGNNVFQEDVQAHRTRKATIVMDGKANGKLLKVVR